MGSWRSRPLQNTIFKNTDLVQHTQEIWQPRLEREKGTQEISAGVLNSPLIHGFSWVMWQTLRFLMRSYIHDHLIITTVSELKYFHSPHLYFFGERGRVNLNSMGLHSGN